MISRQTPSRALTISLPVCRFVVAILITRSWWFLLSLKSQPYGCHVGKRDSQDSFGTAFDVRHGSCHHRDIARDATDERTRTMKPNFKPSKTVTSLQSGRTRDDSFDDVVRMRSEEHTSELQSRPHLEC